MPLTTISIFKPGTEEELTYNTMGEICQCGPGTMLGYDDPEATAKAPRIKAGVMRANMNWNIAKVSSGMPVGMMASKPIP